MKARAWALLLALAGAAACAPALPPPGEVRVLELDLLEDGVGWEVREARAGDGPRRGALATSIDPYADGGDLPALVLPPPARVELVLPADRGALRLRAASGVDVSLARRLPPGGAATLHFELRVDGRLVHERSLRVEARRGRPGPGDGSEWAWVGGDQGLEAPAGARLSLATRAEGLESLAPGEALAGFGGLTLERRAQKPRARARADAPNLVLVVMDTQRVDRTSAYGYARPTTPHLARLAARGVLYEQAFATSSWTWPATASILTGLPPAGHGVTSHRECWLGYPLQTLAEVLGERGYATGGFSANPLVTPARNFQQGFERFDATRRFTDGAEVMPAVLEWVRAHAGARFFLYLHLVDPHTPHNPLPAELARLGLAPPPGFPADGYERLLGATRARLLAPPASRGPLDRAAPDAAAAWISDVYDACVASGDHWLGTLLDLLDELGLGETTVVAYTSDHGEELLDHGTYDHAHSLHPELVRVPLVLAGPGIPRGVRVATAVSNRHVAPTLARLGGTELPAATDAFDLGRPERVPARDVFYSTRKGLWGASEMTAIEGVRSRTDSLHWASEGRPHVGEPLLGARGDARLYDLARDPGEHVDRAREDPERVEALLERLRAHRAHWAPLVPSRRATGAATLELLRAVGYAGEDQDGR